MKKKVEKIWQSLHSELRAFILKRVGDSGTADDILQEVFLKYMSSGSTLNDPSKTRPWLYQVTRNLITDHFRETKRKKQLPKIQNETETVQWNVNEGFIKNCVLPSLTELPEKYQAALDAVFLQDHHQIELAQQSGLSYSGVKSRVQRGKSLLKTLVTQKCHPETDRYGNIIEFAPCQTCSDCSCN
ncbi:MAG: sigma-70 family RNA polymerase sigma factor [Bacteroidota bacterium]|nr:sigma-70 family RNA polymerase sigma factor [Bacteroidota bacterium]